MMATPIKVRYFDGKISTAHTAEIMPLSHQGKTDGFTVSYGGHELRYCSDDGEYLPAVGGSPHALMMKDGSRIEFVHGVPEWLTLEKQSLFAKIAHMESRWVWIGTSVVIMCVLVFGMFKFAIPLAAHHIAQRLPADIMIAVGDQAESYVMDMTTPSTLPKSRQDDIVALYDKLDGNPKAKIIVRGGGDVGANALAIPNNTIIITDELIHLTDDDNQILAVLAHEQGHLVHRHSLEQAINSLGISVLIVVITGDTSDMLLTLPALLTAADYSQKAELQADRFAINELKRLNVSAIHLADFFEKMKQEQGDGHGHWSLLSTHPKTDKRIEQVYQYQ